jgi:hypothetical protein
LLLKLPANVSTQVRSRRHTGRMSNIDRQRIGAVRAMEALGYAFDGIDWNAPAAAPATPQFAEADALHALLVLRADTLEGCIGNSEEAREFAMIAEALEAYEAVRWPDGKVPGGKG